MNNRTEETLQHSVATLIQEGYVNRKDSWQIAGEILALFDPPGMDAQPGWSMLRSPHPITLKQTTNMLIEQLNELSAPSPADVAAEQKQEGRLIDHKRVCPHDA